MATRKKKNEFDMMAVIKAMGGGVAAQTVNVLLQNNVQAIKDKPILGPLAIATLSAGGLYTMDQKYSPIFYGMMGAVSGDLVSQVTDFFGDDESKALTLPKGTEDLEELTVIDPEFISDPMEIDFSEELDFIA